MLIFAVSYARQWRLCANGDVDKIGSSFIACGDGLHQLVI